MATKVIEKALAAAVTVAVESAAASPKSTSPALTAAQIAIKAGGAAYTVHRERPEVSSTILWRHPKADHIEQAVKEAAGVVLYHGTHDVEDMIAQAEKCPEGLGTLEKRVCGRGDEEAGIYVLDCPFTTVKYTGASILARIASAAQIQFDPVRGTPYFPASATKHLVEVRHITNAHELLNYKSPGLVESIGVFAQGTFRGFQSAFGSLHKAESLASSATHVAGPYYSGEIRKAAPKEELK